MRRIRKSWFLRNFWTFMAIYVLNCSVDMPDEHADHVPEDLQINDQESIVELILEVGLGMEDAIPEQEDADADQENSLKKPFSFDLLLFFDSSHIRLRFISCIQSDFSLNNLGGIRPGFFEIPSPPPDFT
ncbi:hypothetical protein [Cyclobacterium xiamenense]|uniref:hypothetical protein n=1 Tax=Cyclobacterium xiamenense TaxID=1297121 RepID=UPI0012B6B6CC|nr:hypothetical protein [Cyclobacterium xiamenense]